VAADTASAADLERHVGSTFDAELREISDDDLRARVVATWVRAMRVSGTADLASGIPPLKKLAKRAEVKPGLGLEHVRAVTRFAIAIADAQPQAHGLRPDRDVVVAAALLHDVGKLLEQASPDRHPLAGTMIRHAVSGVHLAMLEDVPAAVMHAIAYHASEGHRVPRSLECHIVHVADELAVDALERRELGESGPGPYIFVPA
jgi:putative nucleotidyltransferase with HDIG domain